MANRFKRKRCDAISLSEGPKGGVENQRLGENHWEALETCPWEMTAFWTRVMAFGKGSNGQSQERLRHNEQDSYVTRADSERDSLLTPIQPSTTVRLHGPSAPASPGAAPPAHIK